ncbi:centrosomal protein of 55 kDa isoform X1 [Anolis carolinensis]|uniref:centrosomal protein of 55 kDa isoform X1 n=1 Tax=Anolis carolinensis TaxID=28377 RepID=UPI0002C8973F|nr:PREDICTED: centrosomal protein of 55 kDa isoform X1 [Anolis carolinensis]|eukprot:XP_008113537.1 PREDICTED: centrosomal protein of 55 kDa isoform X1 [Anolis carolinensis]
MTSKATKEMTTCISKWGLKSGNSKSESELQVYKKENAALKKSLEEIIKGKSKMTPEERKRLLEKILALQTETEKYKNILGERDHEIQLLKDKLKSGKQNSDTASLHSQLEEKSKEMAKREQLLKSLSEEVNRLNSQLSAVTARYSDLENRAGNVQASQEMVASCSGTSGYVNDIGMQLKDALDKNQQWLLYDQQREVYVQGLLARIFELEQQAKEAKPEENKQRYYEQLLATVRNDLQAERRNVSQLHSDLNEVKRKYDEAKQEVMNLNSLQKQHKQFDVKTLQDENHIKGQIIQRLTHENDAMQEKLDEERKRTQTLSSQVEMLHRSLIKQQEENTRMATLEQQIQACTLDFENEKLDRHNLQHQLNKVLKELRKAREQITRLEPSKLPEHGECIEVIQNFQTDFQDKLTLQDKCSSPKRSNLLDESFLECPKCKAQYPTSQHRELLAHIDFCAD